MCHASVGSITNTSGGRREPIGRISRRHKDVVVHRRHDARHEIGEAPSKSLVGHRPRVTSAWLSCGASLFGIAVLSAGGLWPDSTSAETTKPLG